MSKEDKHKEDKHKEEKTKYEKNKDKESDFVHGKLFSTKLQIKKDLNPFINKRKQT